MYHFITFLFIYYFISICLILSIAQQARNIYIQYMDQYKIRRTLVFDIITMLIIVTILPILTLIIFIQDIIRKDD